VGPKDGGPARQWVIRVTRVAVSGCTGAVGAHGRTGTCRWARVAPQWTREEAGARATPRRGEELLGAGTPHQDSPSRWEQGWFDRFPVLPIRPGSKNDRELVPNRTKKPKQTEPSRVSIGLLGFSVGFFVRFGEPCTAHASCQRKRYLRNYKV
jgi:hypothetical protein